MSFDSKDPRREISAAQDAPPALLAYARAAYSDEIVIKRADPALYDDYQGSAVLAGDWITEFDGQIGILWRPAANGQFETVTRNDGMPKESI